MRTARLLLLALVLTALVSVFAGGLLRPLLEKYRPQMDRILDVQEQVSDSTDASPEPVVHLLVLNGTDQPNLAGHFSLLLDRVGCVAHRVDNAPHTHFATTLLINRRLSEERILRLAADMGGVQIIREADPSADEDAVLVLGLDHAAVWAHLDSLDR